MRTVTLLGSTGSIGTQAVDVVRRNPDRFDVVAVAARGSRPADLAAQAVTLAVDLVGVTDPEAAEEVERLLRASGSNASKIMDRSSANIGVMTPMLAVGAGPMRSCSVRKQAKVSTEPASAR